MSSYLLDVMCASQEYDSLGWRWNADLSSIHVYCKMLWENKFKEDYELMCNGLFATIYQILFGEEASCLSPEGQRIVKEYGNGYMTPDKVYIRIESSTKAPHWLPHFVPDTLLLHEISYHTYVNDVLASLHRNMKGLWLPFPLPIGVQQVENFKQAKDEVGILSSFRFKEVSFQRHDP